MSVADWASVASAVIAFVSMVGAIVGWCLARKAKAAAAKHEGRALKAAEAAAEHEGRAADAAERSAIAAESADHREAQAFIAIEEDPWKLESMPDGDCWLINRSSTPKYAVEVGGLKVHNGTVKVGTVGPRKRKEISINRIMADDDNIHIGWHNAKDESDEWKQCVESLPPSIG